MRLTRRAPRGVLALVLLGVMTLSVVGAGTAWAGPEDKDRDKGSSQGQQDRQRSGGSGWTEDNDTNDGGTPNNVPDDGDNRHPSGKDRSTERGGSGTQGRSASDPDGDSNGGPDKPNGSGGVDKADQDGNNGCGNDDDFEDDNRGNCGGRKPARTTTTTTAPGATAASSGSSGGGWTRRGWSSARWSADSSSSASAQSTSQHSAAVASVGSTGAAWMAGSLSGLVALEQHLTTAGSRRAGGRLVEPPSGAASGGRVTAAGAPAIAFADDGTRVMGTTFERDEPPAFAFTGGDFGRLVLAGLLALALGGAIVRWRSTATGA